LLAKRVKIHHHEDDVVPRGGHLCVKQNRVVIGVIEAQVRERLKRAVLFPDSVYARNPVLDVSGRIPIAFLKLVLLGIEILLTTRQGLVLAQLVSTVDSIKGRKRRSHKHPNHECRAAALLNHKREDVGCVRPQVRPKIFAHFSLRKLREILDQLLLRISPREIGVALVKPCFGQRFHHLWPGKGFGEKNRVRIFFTDAFD
jgi:hypothetical protein